MKRADPLTRGYHLFRRGKYAEVLSLLEGQIFLYRDNPRFYHLLGIASLRTGDAGGADAYLNAALKRDPGSTEAHLALAAACLRRHKTEEALQIWLDILDDDPRNKYAQRGLSLLRRDPDGTELYRFTDPAALAKLYPAPKRIPSPKVPLAVVAVAGLVVVALAGARIAPGVFAGIGSVVDELAARSPWAPGPEREGAEYARVDDEDELIVTDAEQPRELDQQPAAEGHPSSEPAPEPSEVDPDSWEDPPSPEDLHPHVEEEPRYRLSEVEVSEVFDRMREYFNEERDNKTNREINRILYSNAAGAVKERARLLQAYLRTPSFVDMEDNFAYEEVVGDPYLYENGYVRWRGRPDNLDITEQEISFDLLVGYDDGRNWKGTVPVRFDEAVSVDPDLGIEVLGRVQLEEDGRIWLEGVAVRLLRLGD